MPKWLANMVPMKNKGGQTKICVDFRDLNKTCSKDEFPLPKDFCGFHDFHICL